MGHVGHEVKLPFRHPRRSESVFLRLKDVPIANGHLIANVLCQNKTKTLKFSRS